MVAGAGIGGEFADVGMPAGICTNLPVAGRRVQPGHLVSRITPIGEDEVHAYLERGAQMIQVVRHATLMVHGHLAVVLSQQLAHANKFELAIVIAHGGEEGADAEGPHGVDGELAPGPVGTIYIAHILAAAVSVTVLVEASLGFVALVGRPHEGRGIA